METMLKEMNDKLTQIHQMMDFVNNIKEVNCDYRLCDDYPFLNTWAKARDSSHLYYNRDQEKVVFIAESYDGHNGNSFDREEATMSIYTITSSLMDIIYDRMLTLVKARTSEIRHKEQQQSKSKQDKKILDAAGLNFIRF